MKKTQFTCLLGIGASLIVPATAAHAHFLWGCAITGAEPIYRLSISETPQDVNDLEHIEEAKDSVAWAVGGKNIKLTLKGGALEAPLTPATNIIAAGYSWGVFPDKNKNNYLLDLYAKAAVNESAAAESANLPLEVFARRAGKEFVATVKSQNKPLSKAEVVVTSPDEKVEKTLKTDKNGTVRFPYTKAGLYTVRAINVVTPRTGAHSGKYYKSVHGYSTLTFTAS